MCRKEVKAIEGMKSIRLNGDAVRLVIEGEKTQVRIALKKQDILGGTMTAAGLLAGMPEHPDYGGEVVKPPYKRGEVVWVKETWARSPDGIGFLYASNLTARGQKWQPSGRMPAEAARIFIKMISVRVERLQDISAEDIEAEGVWSSGTLFPRDEFAELYDRSLSRKKRVTCSWSKNPWVWVYSFEICERPQEQRTV